MGRGTRPSCRTPRVFWIGSAGGGPRDSFGGGGFCALQPLDRVAGVGGAGGFLGAFLAGFADWEAGAESALVGGHGAGAGRLAAGDRGAVAGAAYGRAAVPGEWADPAALAGGDAAGGEAWVAGGSRCVGDRRRSGGGCPGGAG